MTRREALIALLCTVCLAVLPGCSNDELTVGGENGPISHNERALILSVDEESQTAEVRLPAPMLRFFSQTVDELVADFAETPELALEARADGEDLVITFTELQLTNYRLDVEQSLDESVASLLESEDVGAMEVTDDHASVTITASPALLDKPLLVGQAFMAVPGMCATLQAIDGVADWHVDITVIDAEKNVEVARVTLPDESVTITAESWAEAVG